MQIDRSIVPTEPIGPGVPLMESEGEPWMNVQRLILEELETLFYWLYFVESVCKHALHVLHHTEPTRIPFVPDYKFLRGLKNKFNIVLLKSIFCLKTY